MENLEHEQMENLEHKLSKDDIQKDQQKENNTKDINTLRAEFVQVRSEMLKDKNMLIKIQAFHKREL